MIPYKDDNPTERIPIVTIVLIVINVIVFIAELADSSGKSVYFYGAIPSALLGADSDQPVSPPVTLLTSMFMHGGILHLLGNMLYLWIFGNNVEDRMGKPRFIAFYALGGVVAAYAHALSAPDSVMPMIGASGAIAAVLGAYLLLYPKAQVHTLIFLGFFVQVVRLPALIVIGFWAIIQIASGLLEGTSGAGGGVAWFAHVGGFVFGLSAARVFIRDKYRRRIRWS